MKRTITKIYNKFSDLGIRDKLLLLFILLISLPVLIIAIRSYYVSSNIFEEKTNKYSHDILYQTTKMAESRLDKIEDISFTVAMNQEVQDTLLTVSTEKLDDYEETQVIRRMETFLSSQVLDHNEIEAIYVISFGPLTITVTLAPSISCNLLSRILKLIFFVSSGLIYVDVTS